MMSKVCQHICMVRHGQTDWNLAGRLQGREDIPLNQTGILQAEECALAIKQKLDRAWAAIVTSPLKRARQTAEVIARIVDVGVLIDDMDLCERDYGKASGMTAEERGRIYPDGMYEGLEDWDVLKARVHRAVIKAADDFSPRDLLIVSHGHAISSIIPELQTGGSVRLKNASISMFTYKKPSLVTVFYNKTHDELGD